MEQTRLGYFLSVQAKHCVPDVLRFLEKGRWSQHDKIVMRLIIQKLDKDTLCSRCRCTIAEYEETPVLFVADHSRLYEDGMVETYHRGCATGVAEAVLNSDTSNGCAR